MKYLYLFLLLLFFSGESFAQPANNNFASATDVTALINAACTSGGTYTTTGATADQAKGSCWSNGPNNNVWFKFTATATLFINVRVKVSGAGETMRNPFVAIFDASLTQLNCMNYQGAAVDLSLSYYGLTAGNTYYIQVDNYSGYSGKFDLCLSDVVDYDYKEGATDVTGLINAACTSGGTYTTQFGTPDQSKGSCWSNGPNNNRWFKFTATATTFINVQVKVSGAGETMRNPFVAIFDASLTQVACQNYQGAAVDLSLSYYGLTVGNTYYIQVDNFSGYPGTFDICLSDVVDYDYPQGAVDLTSNINSGCTSGGTYTTQYATSDHSKGSCWSNGPNNNRWFKFTATATTFINVQVKVSGAGETMRNPFVAIFDVSLTQVACQNYQGAAVDLSLSYYGLTAGNTYYIQVDNFSGYPGTFDICLSDVVDYDYPQGAVDLTSNINSGCTSGGTYTTQYATPDHSKGSCWSNGPNNNRWFKFTATATTFINVQVKVSGAGETMRNPFVAIFDASLTQVACQNYLGSTVDLSLSYYGLTPGNTYYIQVDNFSGYAGTFDLCLSDVVDYDYQQGAIDLTSSMNGCSTGGAYSTSTATPDHSKGSCWSNGPNNNRWFKFTATATTFINVQVKVSGAGETMRNPFVAIFDASLTQVACQNYLGSTVDLSLSYYGLTPGNTYYVEVDNFSGYTGTFDICIYDQPDYDYPQGAITLTNLNNYCSTGGAYSTSSATPDHSKGSCWSNGPNNNRWFKFQAISANVTIQVKVSGAGETMRNPFCALWNASLTQLACQNYLGSAVDISISYASLTVGNWYYISVDNFSGYTGTFDICINNASSVQYYSIADGDWTNTNCWSTTGFGGSAAGTIPALANIVYIQDHSITVTSNQSCAEIDMTVSSANTSLTVDNSTLTVDGQYNVTNSGINNSMITTIQNAGTITISDNASFTRSGGNSDFQLNVNNSSVMNVGQDMLWTSTAGTVLNNLFTVNNTGTVSIVRDFTINYSGGQKISTTFNNASSLSVGRDLTFTSTAAASTELIFNNSATMSIKRNIIRGATPYGNLTFNNSSSLTFNGTANTQTFPGIVGSGGDAITYKNVIVNNTSGNAPAFTLGGAVTINGTLTLTSGKIATSTYTLTMASGSSANTGSSNSFVDGIISYNVAASGSTTINFPIGKSADWRPVTLTVNHADASLYSYTAQLYKASAAALGYTLPGTINKVSTVHYWQIDRSSTLNLNSASVQLYYGNNDGVTDYTNLTIAKTTASGSPWIDIGGTATANGTGNIVSGTFASFSKFTLANKVGGTNPLPVELLSFDAKQNNTAVDVLWQTASEKNCDYFAVEKSQDGNYFIEVAQVKGAGNSNVLRNYESVDTDPFAGLSYYRLMETDFNGDSYYSSIVPVEYDSKNNFSMNAYPSITSSISNVNVQLNGKQNANVLLVLRDVLGREYYSKVLFLENGNYLFAFDKSATISPGVYFITASSDNHFLNKKIVIK